MRIREDVIEWTINGKARPGFKLDKDCPAAVVYIENTDYAKQNARGLSEKENMIETLKRSARAAFDSCFDDLEELEKLDPQAAEKMRVDLGLEEYFLEDETSAYLGGEVYCTPNVLEALQDGGPIVLDGGRPVQLTGAVTGPIG